MADVLGVIELHLLVGSEHGVTVAMTRAEFLHATPRELMERYLWPAVVMLRQSLVPETVQ